MTKNRIDERQAEIIRQFYDGKFDSDSEDRIKKKFMLWLKDNRESLEAQEIFKELYEAEKGNPESVTKERINEIMQRIGLDNSEPKKRAVRRPLRHTLLRVAAVVLPLLVVGGVLFTITHKPDLRYANEWVVPNGEIKSIALPDSSKIMVNAGSVLTISQDNDTRVAQLNGESYFKVAKDEKRPFIVKTDEITVRVLGTEFNIEAYPESNLTVVTLAKGSISLDAANGQTYKLTPNERFIYNRASKEVEIKKIVDLDSSFDWMKGRVVCEMKTVGEMLKMIERKYNVEIEVDPSLSFSDIRYTTEFGSDLPIDGALETLRIVTEGFDYEINGNRIRITKQKAS